MRIIDETHTPHTGKVIDAFAKEEWLCRRTGNGEGPPLLYLWRHKRAFVLGLRDSKLPYAPQVMEQMERDGISTAVRHSGGAAVPLDEGVVNVSLITPKPRGRIDFHDDFRLMFGLVRSAIERLVPHLPQPVECGEVVGSYCPGDFDMSIGGRKFCGLAQRRQIGAISVQAFVLVEQQGEARMRWALDFYQAAANEATRSFHPPVRSGTMASLAELVDASVTVEAFVNALKEECRQRFLITDEKEQADVPFEEVIRIRNELERRYKP